jgi:hypothetical protein
MKSSIFLKSIWDVAPGSPMYHNLLYSILSAWQIAGYVLDKMEG